MFKTLPQDDSGPLHLECQQPAELLIRDLEAYDGGRTTDSESVVRSGRKRNTADPSTEGTVWLKRTEQRGVVHLVRTPAPRRDLGLLVT
jgi:hypothetical protein